MRVQELGVFVLVWHAVLLLARSAIITNAFSINQHNGYGSFTRIRGNQLGLMEERSAEIDVKGTSNVKGTNSVTQIRNSIVQGLASTFIAATVWAGSIPFVDVNSNTIQIFMPQSAVAKEMASGSGSRVNKDPESLLRLGLPISNKEVRKVQTVIEEIRSDIASKRKSAALDGVKRAKTMLSGKDSDKIKSACRDSTLCGSYIEQIVTGFDPLSAALKDSQEAFNGSEQERAALDKAYAAQKNVINFITLIEEQMVPPNYKVPVPIEYKDLPQLQGRATVEMTITRPNKGETFDVDGRKYNEAKMTMIIDGYSSPITAGNFIDLVQKGFYNKMDIQRSDGFVVQTGDPEGDAVGYVAKGSPTVGNGPKGERLLPLEIFIKGDKAPIYETSIEDEGRGGEATVLPFSSYGAMGWAREEYDPNSGSSQFFWLLFDSDLTPAGKNVLDGRYPCFGYVVEGSDFLSEIKEGDIIVSATVTKGANNLISPS